MRYLLILFFVISTTSQAQQNFLENGFKQIKQNRPAGAFNAWLKGGPLDGTEELQAQLPAFGEIAEYYGQYHSHEYISERSFGDNNKIVYAIMNFEKGAMYMRFLLYKLPNGNWTSLNFYFHTQPEKVWPSQMLTD